MIKILLAISLLIVTLFVFNQKNSKLKDEYFMKNKKLNFLWSRGILEKDDYMKNSSKKLTKDYIKNNYNDNLWVRLSSCKRTEFCDLDLLAENINLLKNPVTLVTTDGDKSVPSELKDSTFKTIINSEKIKIWFTQNYDGTCKNEKLKPYPIGLDLHTNRKFFGLPLKFLPQNPIEKINKLIKIREKNIKKEMKIFSDVHNSTYSNRHNNERKRIKDLLFDCSHVDFLSNKVSENKIWEKYSSYEFVFSTHGNGLDCHRTWEIIFLGGIVITKKSSLDKLFENLPVVIVEDWDECLDYQNLVKWKKLKKPLTSKENTYKYFKYDNWLKI